MEKFLSNLLLYLLASSKKMFATTIIFIIYLYILMLPDFLAFDKHLVTSNYWKKCSFASLNPISLLQSAAGTWEFKYSTTWILSCKAFTVCQTDLATMAVKRSEVHVNKERIHLAPSSDDLASVFWIMGDISYPLSGQQASPKFLLKLIITQLEDQDLKVLAYRQTWRSSPHSSGYGVKAESGLFSCHLQ